MAQFPNTIKEAAELDYKLGIKSSLSKIASVIGLTYALFKANDKHAHLEYSEEYKNDAGLTKIRLKQSLQDKIVSLFPNLREDDITSNPLVNAQMEALQVGLQLIYKFARVSFVDGSSSTIERTGKNRFAKQLDFGTNILILDALLSAYNQDQVAEEIANWINNTPSSTGHVISDSIKKVCAIFSEDVPSKIRTPDGDEIIFKQQGIYERILEGEHVISSDAKENVGPFRIFSNIFKEGLHPYIENSDGLFVREGENTDLQNYFSMVENTSAMLPKRTIVTTETQVEHSDGIKNNIMAGPLQVIYYGAPGTGKSHQTDKLVESDKDNKIHQRTTFHPDSDYSSFVGCYKPSKDNKELTYKFVAQAFLKAYVDAWKNISQPYYLIIEEINRGNCAQIFGDIFQLLDRREDGFSKYHITTDSDIELYLRDEAFKGFSSDELPIISDINTEQIISGKIMQLPCNLHIYATMNTSDQSLFPIDSAFKRRWEWEYKPIEQPQDSQYRDWKIVTEDGAAYDWWAFLNAVNDRIFETTQSEDKKMGYWFTKADTKKRITQKKFIGKVLFYLWNDVFKDYARTESTVFKVYSDSEKKGTEEYTFTDFFRSEGVTERIHRIMFTLDIEREEWVEPDDLIPNPNGESDAQIMPENPKEIVTYWTDFKHNLIETSMKDVIESYPIPNGPRFQTALPNEVGLTNTYILAITKLKATNKEVTVCAGFNKTKVKDIISFLYNQQEEINAKIQELTGVEPSWSENQYSITIFVGKDGIDKEWQIASYQALYEYFTELLKHFKAEK